jgi:uncharacterized protein involved in exopolysaccharide biosynthesis
MIWTRLVACAGLLGVLALAPPVAHAGETPPVHQLQYARSLTELLANARAERVMAEVEVAFLEEQLAAEGWQRLLFELEDELVAELVDAWMEVRIEELGLLSRYGEKHLERVAVTARLEVLEDAVRRETASVIGVRRMRLDLSRAMEDKFVAALTESGGTVNDDAMAPIFAGMLAQLRALELEARVEAEHHEQLLADGRGEQLARYIGKGGLMVALLARLEMEMEDAQLALQYGDQHPQRVDLQGRIDGIDRLLAEQTSVAVAASRLRTELLQHQIEAMEALLDRGAEGEETP